MKQHSYKNSHALLCDCMDFMHQQPDNRFDLAIVDPPYGIGADKPSIKPNTVKQKNGSLLSIKQSDYGHKNWDAKIPGREYFDELFRVSKHQIVWGVNYFSYECFGPGRIIWDKLNGTSDQYGCEIAYVSLNNRTDIVYYMWRGMMQGAYCGRDLQKAILQQGNKTLNESRIHPTQKPVLLYGYLLNNYAKPGDRILDTHLGSGSSRIASYRLALEFVGIEIDPEYFSMQNERFERECLLQKPLF